MLSMIVKPVMLALRRQRMTKVILGYIGEASLGYTRPCSRKG